MGGYVTLPGDWTPDRARHWIEAAVDHVAALPPKKAARAAPARYSPSGTMRLANWLSSFFLSWVFCSQTRFRSSLFCSRIVMRGPSRSFRAQARRRTNHPEEGPQGSGDATPGFEGKRVEQRVERPVANHRRQPGTATTSNWKTG
jgi:hypothetical protein